MDTLKEISAFQELHDYIILSYIGKGSYGKVYYALERNTSVEVAIKATEITSQNHETLYQEATILSSLNHPNIVKFLKVVRSTKKIFLIMEYVKNGNLNELLEERRISGQRLSDYENSLIVKSIISAVAQLHTHGIVHRDIKLENILIQDKANLSTIKLIDFGLSDKFDGETKILSKFCGSALFHAPEQIKYEIYSKPVDIWSCGIILYMLCNDGKHPFYEGHEDKKEFYEKLLNPQMNFPTDFEELPRNLFMKMTAVEPSDRHTADMILNHPWITRRFNSNIPMTCSENMRAFSQQKTTSIVIRAVFFLMVCRAKGGKCLENEGKQENSKKEKRLELMIESDSHKARLEKRENDLGCFQTKLSTVQHHAQQKIFRILSKSNSPIKNKKDFFVNIQDKNQEVKENDLKKSKEKPVISPSGSNNKNQASESFLWKNPELNPLPTKSLKRFSHEASNSNPNKTANHFQIKAFRFQTNETPQKKPKEEEKPKDEKKLTQSISASSLKKKTSSVSPKSIFNPPTNSKNQRSLSINTESTAIEYDNFMKKEELMLKILQPLNCESLIKAKQFTELKGVFSSLIMISPTKNLSTIANFSKSRQKKKSVNSLKGQLYYKNNE